MEPNVYPIEPEYVHRVWADAAAFLKKCEPYANEYTVDQLKVDVVAGRSHLLAVAPPDGPLVGALVVDFLNYPNARVGFVKAYGGRWSTTKNTVAQMLQWMRDRGATVCQCAVRDQMVPFVEKIGFERRYTVMEQQL